MNTLKALYHSQGKHSGYQILPDLLKEVFTPDGVPDINRYEKERWDFIAAHVNFKGKTVLDIGCNIGYFSMQSLSAGASHITCFEGNTGHTEFLTLAAKTIGKEAHFSIQNRYYHFDEEDKEPVDVVVLLNVLHHTGDDYRQEANTIEMAKSSMLKQLNSMAPYCREIIFQLGFNWMGDRNRGLFEHGTKEELIAFVTDGIRGYFEITAIGVATGTREDICYATPDAENLKRNDKLGEFLNRPIFILKSLK